MKTYDLLSRISFLGKYSYKFLFVAFLGIHIPLIGLIFYALFATEISTIVFIIITVVLTLSATLLTLRILNSLLKPIILGKTALKEYVENQTVPSLPVHYDDEIGEMLKDIQTTISRLEEINKEKGEMIELISHDLRTPIAQTLQVINFLKTNGNDPEERASNLDLLKTIATKQLKFLEDMLRILKAKQIEIAFKNFEVLSIKDLMNEIITNNATTSHKKQLVIINAISKTTKINGHYQGIRQVFANLLSNAIKFSENGGKIEISETNTVETVNITIKDHGAGFNEQIRKILFKKFVPGHLGTNGEPSTGLGLYLAKSIVDKHHGTIKPYSDGDGKGASFEVSLPIKLTTEINNS